MKSSPIRQNLSPKASAAKKRRDLAAANSPHRKKLRADSQMKRRAAKKAGKDIDGMDYDHRTSSFKSVKYNRGGGGKGTKNE